MYCQSDSTATIAATTATVSIRRRRINHIHNRHRHHHRRGPAADTRIKMPRFSGKTSRAISGLEAEGLNDARRHEIPDPMSDFEAIVCFALLMKRVGNGASGAATEKRPGARSYAEVAAFEPEIAAPRQMNAALKTPPSRLKPMPLRSRSAAKETKEVISNSKEPAR